MHLLDDYNLKEPLSVKSIQESIASTENISMRGNRTSARPNANRSQVVSLRPAVSNTDDDVEGL